MAIDSCQPAPVKAGIGGPARRRWIGRGGDSIHFGKGAAHNLGCNEDRFGEIGPRCHVPARHVKNSSVLR